MTWEETIQYIRTKPEYNELVKDTYLDEDLVLNVATFYKSEEYKATKELLHKYLQHNTTPTIVDIGAGNGIASIAFALDNFNVIALEPDTSNTVGTGAIATLVAHYKLTNVKIIESYAEEMPIETNSVDIVYCRQAMHHAYNLNDFIKECSRLLKKGGVLLTTRDHVADDAVQKAAFLKTHPLQHFYGGENAFSVAAYKAAMEASGLTVTEILKPHDSAINRSPIKDEQFYSRLNFLSKSNFFRKIYNQLFNLKDRKRPGRLYTFLSIKRN